MKNYSFARYAILFLLGISFSLLIELSGINGEANAAEVNLTKIFEYAKNHDVKGLERLKSEVESSSDSTVVKAYSLALYMVAPEKYETQFVEKFPSDTNGIMHDLYENIELKRFTPKFMYSVEAIGKIALKGNEMAIKKVLIGSINSDGIVAEVYCEYVTKLFDEKLHGTLIVLAGLDSVVRKGVYQCLLLLTSTDVETLKKKIQNIKTNDQRVRQIIQEISSFDE